MHRFKPSRLRPTASPWRVVHLRSIVVCTASVLFASQFCQAQSVLYVNAAATGLNNGTSWTDAFTDLQSALAVAQSGDEIWVVAGTYRPSGAGGARTIAFQLASGVAIYGGFLGGETLLSERNPAVNVTTLSGDLNGDDGPSFASNGENSFHVVALGAGILNPILDGLAITAGNANSGGDDAHGGGLLIGFLATATVRGCRFIADSALAGGAVYLGQAGPTNFTDCRFEGCRATGNGGSGGAVGLQVGGLHRFTRCAFIGNTTANGFGGGLNAGGSAVDHCTFIGNIAQGGNAGGGGMFAGSGSTLTACTFDQNTAAQGGGLFYSGNSKISDCIFSRNLATWTLGGGFGGGVSQNGGGPSTLVNCKFIGNTCDRGALFAGNGGGGGGGMSAPGNGTPNLINCVFTGNRALGTNGTPVGGGLVGSYAVVRNCTFSNNFASGAGGGVWGLSGGLSMANCIFRANLPFDINSGVPTVTYSCTQSGWAGTGNISADPQFVRDPSPGLDGQWGTLDDDYGDLRLRAGSACIDAGSNAAVPADSLDLDGDGNTTEPTPIDLAGLPRFYDDPATADCTVAPGTCGTAPIVDMGAHEFVTSGDLNCDGHVTLDDLSLFVAALLDQAAFTGCSLNLADVNGDGLVDGGDIRPFITLLAP